MKQSKKKRVRNAATFLRIDSDLREQLRKLSRIRDGLPMIACVRVLVRDAIERSETR